MMDRIEFASQITAKDQLNPLSMTRKTRVLYLLNYSITAAKKIKVFAKQL